MNDLIVAVIGLSLSVVVTPLVAATVFVSGFVISCFIFVLSPFGVSYLAADKTVDWLQNSYDEMDSGDSIGNGDGLLPGGLDWNSQAAKDASVQSVHHDFGPTSGLRQRPLSREQGGFNSNQQDQHQYSTEPMSDPSPA